MDNTATSGQPDTPGGAQPGDTVAPIVIQPTSPTLVASPQIVAAAPAVTLPAPEVTVAPSQPVSAPSEPAPVPVQQPVAPTEDGTAIRWVAAEFIAHQKTPAWYGKLALAIVALAAVVYLLTKDKISTSVVVVAGIALGGYGARQPQQRQYTIDTDGLTIGEKYFPYELFRSFSVIDVGETPSISFFPMKRFGQLTTIYFDPDYEEAIVDVLADRLPIEDRGHDALDRFMHRIKF